MNKFIFLFFVIFFSLFISNTLQCQNDTLKYWKNGWNACYREFTIETDSDLMILGRAFGSGYNLGWTKGVTYKPVTKLVYFSTSATQDTLNAWIQRGYMILYFGTQNSTTKKIEVRGMKPS